MTPSPSRHQNILARGALCMSALCTAQGECQRTSSATQGVADEARRARSKVYQGGDVAIVNCCANERFLLLFGRRELGDGRGVS